MSGPDQHPAFRPVERWTASRKEIVVMAIRRGEVPMAAVLEAHRLSPEELAGWVSAMRRHGRKGLESRPRRRRFVPVFAPA
jgi:transposase-like protein